MGIQGVSLSWSVSFNPHFPFIITTCFIVAFHLHSVTLIAFYLPKQSRSSYHFSTTNTMQWIRKMC